MFIFYQNPYFDIIGAICGVAALMAIAGWGMSAIDEAYKVKDSLNVGIALVSTTIMLITMCILAFTDKTKDITLNTLDANISVNNSMVTINPLPKNYSYNTLDNNTQPKSDQKQVFKYVENTEYDSAYLISEDGGKFKLSDEDREYLKERGVR